MAEAHAPDADRAVPNAPAQIPGWRVHLLALLLLLAQSWALARACGLVFALPSGIHDRPDLPLASAHGVAASIRAARRIAIAWMGLGHGIGPGHRDWPEQSRAMAFGGSQKGFRPGLPQYGVQWRENADIVPGMIGLSRTTLAADAMAALLARPAVPNAPSPALHSMPAEAGPAVSRRSRRPVFRVPPQLRRPDHRSTSTTMSAAPDARGRTTASPAGPIVAAASQR